MIINITQHCTLKCPHCMQCAGPDRTEFMNRETFKKALEFAKNIRSNVLMISGGEPTSHPMFFEFLQEAFDNEFLSVSVLSNGTFLRDHAFTEKFAGMVKGKDNFFMQISSFKELYSNYNEIHKPNLKGLRLFGDRVSVCDESTTEIKMKPLGRACSGKWYEEAKRINGFPSCTNSCLILAQSKWMGPLGIGTIMERNQRFCLPIVSWDGSIRLGESEQCKVVANISEPLEDINEKLFSFRPCGGCASYKWHLEHPETEQEKAVCNALWPGRD